MIKQCACGRVNIGDGSFALPCSIRSCGTMLNSFSTITNLSSLGITFLPHSTDAVKRGSVTLSTAWPITRNNESLIKPLFCKSTELIITWYFAKLIERFQYEFQAFLIG